MIKHTGNLKKIVHNWFQKNSEKFNKLGYSGIHIAEVFLNEHPECTHDLLTVVRYVRWSRNGNLKEIEKGPSNQYGRLTEDLFTPTLEMCKPDIDPLGLSSSSTLDIERIFSDIPETYANYAPPVKITGVNHLGIVSDIHFPVHNRKALICCFSKLKELNIDGLYLNGDIMDCANVTHHERRRIITYTWEQELQVTKAFFTSLRVLFPEIPIWYKLGNHEAWLPRYLAKHAPAVASTYGLAQILELQKLNINVLEDSQVAQYGKLWICHGHEIGLKGGTLNIARQVLMKTNVNIIVGHWHKNDQHERRNLDETVVSAWVTGCLSDLHPDYAPANQMTHGFATAKLLDADGTFVVNPYKIVNGIAIG